MLLLRFDSASLKKSPLNIQKCFLPHCEFSSENYGRYCLLNDKIVVKLGLCDIKAIKNTAFIDYSVIKFDMIPLEKPENPGCICKFKVLNDPVKATKINIFVTFNDVLDRIKYEKIKNFKEILRDILQFHIFTKNCAVFLENQTQNFGLYCIFINTLQPSNCDIYQIDAHTEINVFYSTKSKFMQQEREFGTSCHSNKRLILQKLLTLHKNCVNMKLPKRILLIGPRGSGKTSSVYETTTNRATLLEICPSHINSLIPEDIEKYLKLIFDRTKAYSQIQELCVVLIKNVEIMATGKGLHSKKFVGLITNFLEDIEDIKGIIVIATTSSPESIDPQLRSAKRFEDEIEFEVPNEEMRKNCILNHLFSNFIQSEKYLENYKTQINQIVKWTPGFVVSDLRMLILEAVREMLLEQGFENFKMDPEKLLMAVQSSLTKVVPSGLRGAIGLNTSNTTFSQIGGLEKVKNILNLTVKQQLLHFEIFEKLGVPLTKGILLYGPPGCAKTTLVKALAKECDTNFLATSAADLYSPYVGEAEKKIVRIFSEARTFSPSIIFIDEIDAVVGSKSGDREQGVQERILSTLLIEMDGVGIKVNTSKDNSLDMFVEQHSKVPKKKHRENSVIVIGATNRPQALDSALKRPGRFDRLLYVPPPDEAERLRILRKLTENMTLDDDVDFNYLAKNTEHFSGADLKSLCAESGLHALYSSTMSANRITQSHFNYVLRNFKPSLNEDIINFYESFEKHNI